MVAVLMLASSSLPLALSALALAVAVAALGVGALVAWASAARMKQVVLIAALVAGLTLLIAPRLQAFIIPDPGCLWLWCIDWKDWF